MCTENNCNCRECMGLRLIGPGDDDYGRDNMIVDWECPQCKKITQITGWEAKHATQFGKCKFCGWEGEYIKSIGESIDRAIKDGRIPTK